MGGVGLGPLLSRGLLNGYDVAQPDKFFQGPAAMEALIQAQVDIGQLEVQVKHLTDSVAELKLSNKGLADQLSNIQKTLSEARGGWRVLMLIGGAAAGCGALVSYIYSHITWST